MLLEICASNYQSALNAEIAGAHRIELCTELAVGGLTPSYGLLKQVLDNLKIPVFVLIRPRSGNFTYTDEEFAIMKRDIVLCKELGSAGIVSGVLNKDQTIDSERTKQLVELSKPLPFTFHRAFDWTPNPSEALKILIDLDIERLLTSGQEASADKGIELLKQLKAKANHKITILPGGGINAQNAILFKDSGFSEIHASATRLISIQPQPRIAMNSSKFFDETLEVASDVGKIRAILSSFSL